MDLDAVRKKLQSLQTKSTRQNNLWKPEPGSQVVRIVPYKYNEDYPFLEMYFHYGLGGKTYLSPITFGRPDPLVEFAEKLRTTGDKQDYELSRKLQPKMRTYAPVIVRGQESEGVKFWGFGKTVYQELLGFISDPDYGDITNPTAGRDITVEFTPAETKGEFPKTGIRVKPNQKPISEDAAIIKLVGDQQEITDVFKEPTYEVLQEALENWLNPEGASTEGQPDTKAEAKPEATNDTDTTKVADVGSAFNELFNK